MKKRFYPSAKAGYSRMKAERDLLSSNLAKAGLKLLDAEAKLVAKDEKLQRAGARVGKLMRQVVSRDKLIHTLRTLNSRLVGQLNEVEAQLNTAKDYEKTIRHLKQEVEWKQGLLESCDKGKRRLLLEANENKMAVEQAKSEMMSAQRSNRLLGLALLSIMIADMFALGYYLQYLS